jgi:hypothetical protein
LVQLTPQMKWISVMSASSFEPPVGQPWSVLCSQAAGSGETAETVETRTRIVWSGIFTSC